MKILNHFNVDFNEIPISNNVKLYSFYKPNSPIYFRVYFYAGSQYDEDKSGLAHFCEHMMVSGTEKYPTKALLKEKVDEIGARSNAFTSKKNLWLTIDLADKADLSEMFEIVDQILNKSIFAPDIIEKERGAILAEQTRKTSNPSQYIYELQSSLLFQETNIENPVTGFDESVKGITREDLINYRDKYLTNGQVTYFISGDFDEKIVIDSLNKINNLRYPIEHAKVELPIIADKKELFKKTLNPEQNYLSLSTRVALIEDKTNMISSNLFNYIFGRGSTSRLYRTLRYDKGLVYGVESSIFYNSEFASFSVNTNCRVKDTQEVVKIIKEEFTKIIQKGIDADELIRAKKNILRNLKFESETANFWVSTSLMKELTDQLESILPDEYINILKSITVENINSFIEKYLSGKEFLLAGIGDFDFTK
jgi:predicted Zn-dependent peptidase